MNMKRKICYITTVSITIKAFFIPQLKNLADSGYEVTVICSPDDTLKELLGEKIRYIPVHIARGISPKTLIKSIISLKKVFDKEKFDMVQYSTPNAAFCSSIAAKLANIRIRNYHLMGFRYLGAKGILRQVLKLIERITCINSTHIECVSSSNLELGAGERIFSRKKACVVWNGSTGGIDLKRFDISKRQLWRDEVRKDLGYKNDDFIFGFVGRITKDKGIDELLSAFSNLKNNAKLMLLGSLEGVDTLDKELYNNAKGNENILFHDSVSDVEKYFAAIDVLVFPSYREGFGNVVIEAAAVGTPAIVSNIPGPVDAVIANKTALIVKSKDAQDLADKMQMLADNPELCMQMGSSCVDYVSKTFDSRILIEKILERKESLLG